MNRTVLQENSTTAYSSRLILHRWWDSLLSIEFSPIERWLDGNYAPDAIDVAWENTDESYVIIAPLHGFDRQDAHVDLCRGHVIILFSHHADATSDFRERYIEIPVPADARSNRALVNVTDTTLTVTLYRKLSPFKRAVSAFAQLGKRVDLVGRE